MTLGQTVSWLLLAWALLPLACSTSTDIATDAGEHEQDTVADTRYDDVDDVEEMDQADQQQAADTQETPAEFRETFEAILDNLTTNFWDESGDWRGDMQGDATPFATWVLYEVGRERDRADFLSMADATAQYELDLAIAAASSGMQLSMDVVIGAPALAYRFQHAGEDLYRSAFLAGTTLGYQLILDNPEAFQSYVFELPVVYGTAAYLCFLAYDLSGQEHYIEKGLTLIDRANADHWDEQMGMYRWELAVDWPQATMMMALVAAYRLTADNDHLERSLSLLTGMNSCCWDEISGGYSGHFGERIKALSGNNNMAWALLDLYEVTQDKAYLDRVRAISRFVLSEDLYDSTSRLIYHDWTVDEGRASSYCTGCNFQTLCNLHRYFAHAAQADSRP